MCLKLFRFMVSKDSIWKFVKSERFVVIWWAAQWGGSLLCFGVPHAGKFLVDSFLLLSIVFFCRKGWKKVGARFLAVYAGLTMIFAIILTLSWGLLAFDEFVEDVDIIKKLIVIAVPIVACINVLIAFRTIKILGRLEDGVEVEGW